MDYQFDHVIHYVENPDEAKKSAQSLGIHAVSGGKHETRGTYNTLGYFGLSYIEWIGIFDEELLNQNKVPFSVIFSIDQNNYKEGIVRLAVRTTSIDRDAARFKEMGLEVIGPIQANRQQPSGEMVHWQQLYVNDPTSEVQLPFLIQWQEPDQSRQDSLESQGNIAGHPAGELSLKEIRIGVNDLRTASRWAELFHFQQENIYLEEGISSFDGVRLSLNGADIVFVPAEHLGTGIRQAVFTGAEAKEEVSFYGATYTFTNNKGEGLK